MPELCADWFVVGIGVGLVVHALAMGIRRAKDKKFR